jgi:hypothetical protein
MTLWIPLASALGLLRRVASHRPGGRYPTIIALSLLAAATTIAVTTASSATPPKVG